MRPIVRGIFAVLALVASMASTVGAQQPFEDRPIPLGTDGSNIAVVSMASGGCSGLTGTLGALVADQNGNQYILSAAHVFAVNPTGYFSSGSLTSIFQPDFGSVLILQGIEACSQGLAEIATLTSQYGVANLGTVAAPNFAKGSTTMADAVLMPVIAGKVSSNILNIPVFSGTPLTVYKKNLQVEMQGAFESQPTRGHTISKMLVPVDINLCQHQATKGTEKSCAPAKVRIANSFLIKPNDFANPGDSGALILTVGPCPHPVGVLEGTGTDIKTGAKGIAATSISGVLQALQTAGGYSNLSIVPGGGGCSSNLAEIGDGGSPQTFTLQDATVPDADVATALAVLPSFGGGCIELDELEGAIAGIGVDLSVSPAALDVIVNNSADLDPGNLCIPASFEGVPVEQDVIQTIDSEDSFLP